MTYALPNSKSLPAIASLRAQATRAGEIRNYLPMLYASLPAYLLNLFKPHELR
jgi:hypothetical protein